MRHQRLESTRGAMIDSLRPSGPAKADKTPLNPGDIIRRVNDEEIDSVEKLVSVTDKLLKDKDEKVAVLVQFKRGQQDFAGVFRIGASEPQDPPARLKKPWTAMSTQVLLSEMADLMKLTGTRGVRVTEVYPRQSAEKAGVLVGDLIVAVDGNKIDAYRPEDSDLFDSMIRKYSVGAEVELSVIRNGETRKLKMALEAAPNKLENVKRSEDKDFEFTARDMVFEDRNRLKLSDDFQGVFLEQVQQAGWASLGGLEANDVVISINNAPVPDVETLKKILADAKKNHPRRLVFFVRRGILTFYNEIEPDWNNNPGEDHK
jgi:S1-C subfamily serine protease